MQGTDENLRARARPPTGGAGVDLSALLAPPMRRAGWDEVADPRLVSSGPMCV
jgi:hypothetical protein